MSKEVSGTGLRLGFVAGPRNIIKAVVNVEGNTSSCVNLSVQKGFAKFLQFDIHMKERLAIRDLIWKKREVLLHQFQTLEGLKRCKYEVPAGAFYLFPEIGYYIGKKTESGQVIDSDVKLVEYLLEEAHIR